MTYEVVKGILNTRARTYSQGWKQRLDKWAWMTSNWNTRAANLGQQRQWFRCLITPRKLRLTSGEGAPTGMVRN